ncbi:leucyl aminopeptidase [Candidatus Pelagibacter sp. RS40]|uniref:leucyl aminopeptidase n=1 Tax=Candidatus Pelagibacter sp. RS40 TaxID=1977865 RepID=UPI000A153480|nr:leucyl aminopeptidase [Candidatus Pelagibacter sp. RS40]ARJ48667.1 leucyl aminopeptidase [Candidatus Pelagibacter sp. RS40]
MKLKLKFISKISKLTAKNELIFINNKNFKHKILDLKEISDSDLFKEKKVIQINQFKSNYIIVNCLNQKKSSDYENIGSKLFDFLKNNKIENVILNLTSLKITNAQIERILHGATLKSYSFEVYKTKKSVKNFININVVGIRSKSILKTKLDALAEGIFLTRDLVSEPGNILHPDEYVKRIAKLRNIGIKVTVYDKKKLKKMGCGALLGVGQGSVRGSYLVTMEWKGASSKSKPLAFVGKGVCFDTGGISLKPAKFMEDMTYDMAGSAVVVGLMKNFALRKAKINAVGVVGLVENMPGGNAQRPGDIVKSYSGKTIEVLNTDAEGRLVLADALTFTEEKFKPSLIIDLATLTGAIIVSLGSEYAGLFSNNDKLSKQLYDAGEKVEEKVWRMPLHSNYDKLIDSKNADMQNINYVGGAGSTTAAQFLQRFVLNKTPWAHLDIAGMSFSKYAGALNSGGATGYGVRLLNKFVEENYE